MQPDLQAYLTDVPRSFNRMGPEAFNDSEQLHVIADVVHAINDNWTVKFGGIYRGIEGWRNLVTGGTTVTINATTRVRTLPRSAAAIYQPEHGFATQGYLLGRMRYAGLVHKAIAGYEYFSQASQEDVRQPRPNLTAINVDNPNYAVGDPLSYPRLAGRYGKSRLVSRSYSANNLWQAFQQRLTMQLGVRRDETYQARDDFLTPTASFSGKAKPADLISGGAAWRVLPRVALFVSYSESYEPLVKSDYFGRPFDPREGIGMDYGLRWDEATGRISATVTGFTVVNSNLEQADPDHAGFQVQTGENKSQGVEFSLFARPVKAWQVVGSYTYNETRVVKDPRVPANVGLPTANAPRDSWNLWNRYRFESGPVKGLGLGVGVVFVGQRRGNPNLANNPGIRSPAYHRWQASASYAARLFERKTTFSLNVNNVFDTFYRQSYAGLGEPRSVTGRVTFEF
jgi:iron complex outermembrane receptor protein